MWINKAVVGSGHGKCPNTWGRVWHHTDHPVTRVDHPQVSQLFAGNFLITHFGHAASEACHLTFGCYIVNECRDIT